MNGIEHLWTLCLAGTHVVTPTNLWQSWSLAPSLLVPLLLLLMVGLRTHRRPALTATTGRADAVRQRNWFLAGWLLLAVALLSPLCRLSATLVSAHMVQFMLLAGVGPAMLALGRPARGPAPAPGLSLVTLAYGAAIWLWHAPPVYAAVLEDPVWHWLAFATLIGLSAWFWVRIVAAYRYHAAGAMIALLSTLMHTGLLGALLTFAPQPLYPILAEGVHAWNLAPLQDQQLAGLIMWVGGSVFYLLAALVVCTAWLRALGEAGATPGRV